MVRRALIVLMPGFLRASLAKCGKSILARGRRRQDLA